MTIQTSTEREISLALHALQFFTRLPIDLGDKFDPEHQAHAARYLTLVGWLLGGLSVAVYWLFAQCVSADVAAVFALLAVTMATGAFHEDGLADSVDGIAGAWNVEDRLRIMKDSRIGSYGVIALFFVLALKVVLLFELNGWYLLTALLCAPVVSRGAVNVCMHALDYVRLDSSSKVSVVVQAYSERDCWIALGITLPVVWLVPSFIWVLALASVPAALFAWWAQRRLGGYTGDVLGGVQQVCEVGFYFGLLVVL